MQSKSGDDKNPTFRPGDRVQLTSMTGDRYPGTVAEPPEKGPARLAWVRWDDGWESWIPKDALEAVPCAG